MTRRFRSTHPLASAVGLAAALAVLAAAPSIGTAATGARSAPGEPAVGGITQDEYLESMSALHGQLVAELPAGVMISPLRLDLTDDEQREMVERQNLQGGPAVVGRTKLTNTLIRISDLDSNLVRVGNRQVGNGVMAATSDGGFVWAGAIVSQGAAGMRVSLSGLNLPPNAEIYVFNLAGSAFGPYRGRGPFDDGEFWAPTVGGSETIVMLRQRGPATNAEISRMSFAISGIGHISSSYRGVATESFCLFNVDCIENANCYSNPPTAAHRNATAMLQWISGAFINTCTGGLIADTDTGSQIPYILTANHCISRAKDAKAVEAFFFHDDTACGSTSCPAQANPAGPYGSAMLVQPIGTTIKATGTSGDYSLLQLNGAPPAGTAFLGWNATPIANTSGADLRRVHHPAWAPQSYSEHQVDTGAGTCSSLPRGAFIYSADVSIGGTGPTGGTEGGSSGSPVVNASNEIVGQLFGACGTNVGDACDFGSNATVDGALAHYFPNVESFLDPQGGGGCTLLPPGASCTSNAQCCSNSCKGSPGNKTCR